MSGNMALRPVERPLPALIANAEAEQALLGGILASPRALDRVAEFLRPDDFADPAHGRIYQTMLAMDARAETVGLVTLKSVLERDGVLAEAGGTAYLARLAASVVTVLGVENYGRLVRDLADRRRLRQVCLETVVAVEEGGVDHSARSAVESLEAQLMAMAVDAGHKSQPEAIDAIATRVTRTVEAMARGVRRLLGLPTGFHLLDRDLSGLQPGQLIVVGARPGMGKSVFGENIARRIAALPVDPREGAAPGRAVIFSLEMTKEELAQRALAALSGVAFHALREGRLSDNQMALVAQAGIELGRLPITVDDTPRLGVGAIRARARRIARRQGLRLIVIDHLHLMAAEGAENRTQELTAITGALKEIAKELACPVVLLAQLSRKVEEREDKRPQLSDLRESGSIEQDADVVLFLFREQYYLERAEPQRRADEGDERYGQRRQRWQARLDEVVNTAEVIVAKQRNGPVGTVRLEWRGDLGRFDNLGGGAPP